MGAAISIVDYIYELKQAGFTDRQSEVQARKIEQIVAEVKQELKQDIKQELEIDGLATKQDLAIVKKDLEIAIEKIRADLELSIEKVRYDTLKFVVWTGVIVVVTLLSSITGLLAKGFHWF